MSSRNNTITQVSFTADSTLKNKAMKKAKKEGITLKALFTMAMKSYIDGDFSLGLKNKNDYFDKIFDDKDVVEKANELGNLLKKKNI